MPLLKIIQKELDKSGYCHTADDTNWDIENITPKEMMKQIEPFQNVMPKGLMIPIETFKNIALRADDPF